MTPRHGALILALASACTAASGEQPQSSDETSPAERSTPSAQATWVEAATLQRSTTTLELSLPGEVEGSREATIAASQGGFVEAAHVQMGDTVRRGQLLFAVDSS
ncbi:MAG: biotin/lipoyl-binding protein, partial [Deltaproteobacteria bacterium]|nr:biotin/lipoyl-binding protein [Deltaproteobacteria bacterium]